MNTKEILERITANIEDYQGIVAIMVRSDGSYDLVSSLEKDQAFKVVVKTANAMVDNVLLIPTKTHN